MLIKQARYKKCKSCKHTLNRISDEVHGCDFCKKKIEIYSEGKKHHDFLEITVFNNSEDSSRHQLCSWKCVAKFLPTVKSDYFVSLPFLHYEPDTVKGQTVGDFLKMLQ